MKSEVLPATGTSLLSRLATLPKVWIALLVFTLFSTAANATPPELVYVVAAGANGPQFGAVDLANGRFLPIGEPAPAELATLVWWKGSLLSLAVSDPYAGDLVRINPLDGAITVIGSTGLGYKAFSLAELGGKLYLTDFSGNLYTVDPHTGSATFLAATGMPADVQAPFTTNPNGTLNLCDQTLYSSGGSLYVTFDAFNIDPATLVIDKDPADTSVSPALYRINPSTGAATLVAPTYLQFGATVALGERFFAFRLSPTGFAGGGPIAFSEIYTLNLSTGQPQFLRTVDPAAGTIFGAAPVTP
jgi:hypothetical protein